MMFGVLASCQDFKIIEAKVSSVFVAVMNNFISLEETT
jgi:hypothetical protein